MKISGVVKNINQSVVYIAISILVTAIAVLILLILWFCWNPLENNKNAAKMRRVLHKKHKWTQYPSGNKDNENVQQYKHHKETQCPLNEDSDNADLHKHHKETQSPSDNEDSNNADLPKYHKGTQCPSGNEDSNNADLKNEMIMISIPPDNVKTPKNDKLILTLLPKGSQEKLCELQYVKEEKQPEWEAQSQLPSLPQIKSPTHVISGCILNETFANTIQEQMSEDEANVTLDEEKALTGSKHKEHRFFKKLFRRSKQ
ncbi:uncharacterized protein LOC128639618 [Bombina bombina]|uniref:uncharacterized protein LOC128639618 n=1 Tax=Bombina bombina TaxID=8345 RepID=UPI00235AAB7C|nr:uncharacterized protein LOC128639618 [Bombina bombina]